MPPCLPNRMHRVNKGEWPNTSGHLPSTLHAFQPSLTHKVKPSASHLLPWSYW